MLELYQTNCQNRNVLNMFCYTGGFSFYAMKGGARLVHSVDASESAIELTNQNVELNFQGDTRHESFMADGFEFMRDIQGKYDLIRKILRSKDRFRREIFLKIIYELISRMCICAFGDNNNIRSFYLLNRLPQRAQG